MAILALSLSGSEAIDIGPLQSMLPAGVDRDDNFGRDVAMHNAVAVIGSPLDSERAPGAGAVYVFELAPDNSWQTVAKLFASDAAEFDQFGRVVDIDGDRIIVGAPESVVHGASPPNSGTAYVFGRNHGGPGNWGQLMRLKADDGDTGDEFGRAVAIWGDTAVVGARFDDDDGYSSGAAYVYGPTEESGLWQQTQKLTAADARAGDYFGETVSIDAGVMAIGAPGELFGSMRAGKVYVHTPSPFGWLQTGVLTGDLAGPGDRFGAAVAVSGSTVAVGAFASDDDAVYVFDRVPDTFDWEQTARIDSPCDSGQAQFGGAIALHGDLLVVGAPFDDAAVMDVGTVFVYERNRSEAGSWEFVVNLSTDSGAALDQFATAVATSGLSVLVGAPGSDQAGINGGMAYSSAVFESDSDGDGVADIIDNCTLASNPGQRDTDSDGFGNCCDGDMNGDCMVNFADLVIMQAAFFGTDADADLDGDGAVNFGDLTIMAAMFFGPPGPSALQDCVTLPGDVTSGRGRHPGVERWRHH